MVIYVVIEGGGQLGRVLVFFRRGGRGLVSRVSRESFIFVFLSITMIELGQDFQRLVFGGILGRFSFWQRVQFAFRVIQLVEGEVGGSLAVLFRRGRRGRVTVIRKAGRGFYGGKGRGVQFCFLGGFCGNFSEISRVVDFLEQVGSQLVIQRF